MKEKIALFCDIDKDAVIECRDAEILYQVTLDLQAQNLDAIVCDHLHLQTPKPEAEMTEWRALVERVSHLSRKITIGIVGKYVALPDAYLSIAEALKHAGYVYDADVDIRWYNSEKITDDNVADQFKDVDGILVPYGFGHRGIEGKISAIRHARENHVPYFGICLGMQLASVEFARNVLGYEDAASAEFIQDTEHPIIDLLPEQKEIEDLGGTLRLGLYPCKLKEGSLAKSAYSEEIVYERHRHRYEFNNSYREAFEQAGLIFSGQSPDNRLVEIIELSDHPYFVAAQFHPEFVSRPTRPQPLFKTFIHATLPADK